MKRFFILAFLLCTLGAIAQKKDISAVEATSNWDLYPRPLYYLQWLENTNQYVYIKDGKFTIFNANDQKEVANIPLEEITKLAEFSSFPTLLHISSQEMIIQGNHHIYAYNYVDKKLNYTISLPEKAENIYFNIDKKAVAYTLENNLYVTTSDKKEIKVTDYTDKNIVSGKTIHRNEFGIKKGIFWSEKGNYIAFYQKDESNVTDYPLVDVSTTPATLKTIKYPMAGQKSEIAKVGIFNFTTKKTIYLDIDTTDEHFLTNLTWSPDEKYILLAEIKRSQNEYSLNRYDILSGKRVNTILTEQNNKWVEPEHDGVFLPNNNTDFLWISEKDGFNNLYLCKSNAASVKQLTAFRWVIKDILGFDKDGKNVIISGTGTDPRETKLFKVSLKNGKATDITPTEGTHSGKLSKDGSYLIDEFSNIKNPLQVDVINIEKGKKETIYTAKNPLEDYNLATIDFLTLKTADNKTDLYAKIIKPNNFDPNKKYPVLLYVYGGPHAQLVVNSWLADTPVWMLAMAQEQQYIIFTLDNRGSENRGFSFESVIHRDVAKYALEDQLTAVKYLKSLSYVNPKRMSVYGWSFGGFMASTLMLRSENSFTTAVAGGAVIDWKYYEIMYGERYMDTPQDNPEGYEITRVTKYLPNLKGNLLYVHGYIDDVVLPQHFLDISQESIKSLKTIDSFLYPKHKHNVSGEDRKHLIKLVTEYIIKNNIEK
ncbi:MAG: DPP IV N-terminal domain-containing protein [Capnocytophaga sp.]|nr:DPP IV N-terminal domain-containing protein [Capnocytophaga sp.]